MEKREKLLYLAIVVAIIGTAALYALSASMEEQESTHTVSEVLENPERYLNRDISIQGNITDIREYGNTTVFYLREGEHSLRCVSYSNLSFQEGRATLYGHLSYNEEWGQYEFVVERHGAEA